MNKEQLAKAKRCISTLKRAYAGTGTGNSAHQYLFDLCSNIRPDVVSLNTSASGVKVEIGVPSKTGATSADYKRAVIKETLVMTWTEFGNWLETCMELSHGTL
jgi:hypothetical protein